MTDYRACPKCGDPGYVNVAGEHLCGNPGCDHGDPLGPGWESEEHRLRRQLAGAVDALERIVAVRDRDGSDVAVKAGRMRQIAADAVLAAKRGQ